MQNNSTMVSFYLLAQEHPQQAVWSQWEERQGCIRYLRVLESLGGGGAKPPSPSVLVHSFHDKNTLDMQVMVRGPHSPSHSGPATCG